MPVASPEDLLERHNAMTAFLQASLKEDRDYGQIPGTGERSTLLKPGAELILLGFGCYAVDEIAEAEADHNAEIRYELKKWVEADVPVINGRQDEVEVNRLKLEGTGRFKKDNNGKWKWQRAITEQGVALGFYRYVVRTKIIHRATGDIIGSGIGSCSTAESKYIRQPRDAENTVLKMAKKRALIDATLSTFALSERFTQDLEELAENKNSRSTEEPVSSNGQALTPEAPKEPTPEDLKKSARQQYLKAHKKMNLPDASDYEELNLRYWSKLLGVVVEDPRKFNAEQWNALTEALASQVKGKELEAAWKMEAGS